MFLSGFLIPCHQSSCFWVGIFFTMLYLFLCENQRQIICQFVNLHCGKCKVSGNTRRTGKTLRRSFSRFISVLIFLSDAHTHTHTQICTQTQTASLEMVAALLDGELERFWHRNLAQRGQLCVWLMRLTTALLSGLASSLVRFHIREACVQQTLSTSPLWIHLIHASINSSYVF